MIVAHRFVPGTHWLVSGINDDGAIALLRIFEENDFPLEKVVHEFKENKGLSGEEVVQYTLG